MEYQIIKVYNNNVVLAKQDDKQVVLVSKGIGFGKKTGDSLKNDGSIEKVFYELSPTESKSNLSTMHHMSEKSEYVIEEYLKITQDKMGSLIDNYTSSIKEHIEFAIARLQMGLEIENPFLEEIKVFYKAEYQMAGIARTLIKKRMHMDIGDEEQAFIALHLHAAKTQKSLKETIKTTRIFGRCIEIIEEEGGYPIALKKTVTKQFMNNLNIMLKLNAKGKIPRLAIKESVAEQLPKSYEIAQHLGVYLNKEKHLTLCEDEVAYLAIEIERLIQLISLDVPPTETVKISPRLRAVELSQRAPMYIKYLGGKDNIVNIDACITRLRVTVKDKACVQEKELRELGGTGIIWPSQTCIHIVLGARAEQTAETIKEYIGIKEDANV
ncbi:MAG: PRD domain-containing protein [Cellulosilyticaceae bacterium]